MSGLTLDAIRDCLEGAIPSMIATCAPDGTPNVAYLSQVEYVDPTHVALSFQFFNTTRRNALANPVARLLVTDPRTGARYRLRIRYLRTETAGPLFERMRAKLAGIASHTGMAGVFRLQGSDVYALEEIEAIPGEALPPPPPRRNLLSAVRACAQRLSAVTDLGTLLETALDGIRTEFDIAHALVLMLDRAGAKLYTVASLGYADSGVGSEIALGQGVIGVAARERTPIRIGHATAEYAYGRAVREEALRQGMTLETEIPLPGLAEARSQLAVPIEAFGRLIGVLFADSPQDLRFGYDEEDALVAVAGQLGTAIHFLQQQAAEGEEPAAPVEGERGAAHGAPVAVRHFEENDSVFLDGDYLIKGVAGAIFWTLVTDYVRAGRSRFTNRELRLDPRIRLPDLSDNLEARLILLQKRLVERAACVRIEKTGRGQFRLAVDRPLQLVSVATASR
ncbi:MAG TPA: GAF domain-containing protein [Usitatibacter sp.]|nr:GAF domain-containing protein [Usitatibacter sp.]